MKKQVLHVIIPIHGDQIAVLFADKWSAQRRYNAMVKSKEHSKQELWLGEAQLGSRYDRLLRTIQSTPHRKRSN